MYWLNRKHNMKSVTENCLPCNSKTSSIPVFIPTTNHDENSTESLQQPSSTTTTAAATETTSATSTNTATATTTSSSPITETRNSVMENYSENLNIPSNQIISTNYKETSTTLSSNYQDSETTYYDVQCPNDEVIPSENEKIFIENLCNRQNEKLRKPCQNGFCYCFTSDSDEIRLSSKCRTKPTRFRQKSRKPPVAGSSGLSNNDGLPANNNNKNVPLKISNLAAKANNISPPIPVPNIISNSSLSSSHTNTTQKSNNQLIELVKNPSLNKNIVKSHKIVKHLKPAIVKNHLHETYDSDPNAPLVRIIQEVHKNVVISEVRINRNQIKCSQHSKKNEETISGTDEKYETACSTVEKPLMPRFLDKKTQTDNYSDKRHRRDSDSKSSSQSNGGRLLLKRIGSAGSISVKLRNNSQTPPRKPPRSRFSNSSHSTKFPHDTTSSVATPTLDILKSLSNNNNNNNNNNKSPLRKKHRVNNIIENDNDLKKKEFEQNPYRKLREALPSEKEIPNENQPFSSKLFVEAKNYQKASPSCPTLSELSSLNITPTPGLSSNGGDSGITPTTNIGWVNPEIVDMLHYEKRNTNEFHTLQSNPEPQKQQQQQQQQPHQHLEANNPIQEKPNEQQISNMSCWTIPQKKDIDTVDNIPNRAEEFDNFAFNMQSKSTPVKTHLLSQHNISTHNKSLMRQELLNRVTNSPLHTSRKSLVSNPNNETNITTASVLSKQKQLTPTKKRTSFKKKATQGTKSFLRNSKNKFVRFVFGNSNIHADGNSSSSSSSSSSGSNKNGTSNNNNNNNIKDNPELKSGRTIATQTFENDAIINTNTTVTTKTTTNVFPQSSQIELIYPSIKEATSLESQSFALPFRKLPPAPISPTSTFSTTSNKIDSLPPLKADRQSFKNRAGFLRPRTIFKNLNPSTSRYFSTDKQQKHQQNKTEQVESYKSYSDFINSDLYKAAMNDILTSIRTKLEIKNENDNIINNDDNKINQQQQQQQQQQIDENQQQQQQIDENQQQQQLTITTISDTSTIVDNNQTQISATVDIHAEPIYSAIDDQQPSNLNIRKYDQQEQSENIVTSIQTFSSKIIPHVLANNDPNAIYAEIQKSTKRPIQSDMDIHSKNQLEKTNDRNSDGDNDINNKNEMRSEEDQQFHGYDEDNVEKDASDSYYQDVQDFDTSVSYDEPDDCHYPFHDNMTTDFDDNDSLMSKNKTEKAVHPKNSSVDDQFRCYSCPLPHAIDSESNSKNINTMSETNEEQIVLDHKSYSFAERLKQSFRRSRRFINRRLSRKFSVSNANDILNYNDDSIDDGGGGIWCESNLCISRLYTSEILHDADNQPCIKHQIEKAVNICRQMPEFESSTELVEAERLLLFSSLKRDLMNELNCKIPPSQLNIPSPSNNHNTGEPLPIINSCRIFIKDFEIPIKPDGNYDNFFNYFYTTVFMYKNIMKSTQSVARRDNIVSFTNHNIYFDNLEPNFIIRAFVYVLRLRKLCNFDYNKAKRPPRKRTSNCSSDSGDEMISRFRLQGSFILTAQNFAPYQFNSEILNQLNYNKEYLYLKTSDSKCIVSLTTISRGTNLLKEVQLMATVEIQFQKIQLEGFLNIEDNKKRHNWNQRWCQLNDKLKLLFWSYPQDGLEKQPLNEIDLTKCVSYPIEVANREYCSRPKSFSLQISDKNNENNYNNDKLIETYFLSTDTQNDLNYWINGLNEVMKFVRTWMN